MKRRTISLGLLGAGLGAGLAMWGAHALIYRVTDGAIFFDDQHMPDRDVGLVLGCARFLQDGRENLYFRHRIRRAADLYHQGKVQQLLVSGDNSRTDYDEATDMRDALVERGVPADRIHRDYAGFSTLDSVVRAKKVFGQSRLTVISQEFHVRRAVYIGRTKDMDLVGAVAADVGGGGGLRTRLREHLARVKTVLDVHFLRRQPKFLGEPIHIALQGSP